MKKKYYFIGLFLIVTTLLFTMGSSVEANNQIENGFQPNNILTEFKLKNNLWYSENQINNLNSTLDRLTSNLEFQQSNTNNLSPNIKAELSSVTPTSGPNGSEIEVTYTITPEESFDALLLPTSKDKDILFIMDTSISTNNNRLTEFKNALQNVFANYGPFAQRENKVGVILYGDTVSSEFINPYKLDQNNCLQNYQGLLQPVFGSINNTNSSNRKLGKALEEAIKYFNGQLPEPNKPNNSKAEKYIVLFAGDKPTDTISKNMLSGYNLITLAVNNIDNVKELHTYLGGNEAYFYTNTADNGSGMDKPATEIRDLILSGISSKPFTVNATLNFDLGEDFESIDDNLISKGGTSYQLKVPTITYTPVTRNDDGTYRYEADKKEIKVSFKIKVNTEKTGAITFANTDDVNSNNLTYTYLNGTEIKDLIDTPTFTVVDDTEPPTYTNDAIKILEIEPADYFQLGSSQGLETGTEELIVSDERIEITRMTMPEFIGKAEKLNGKYDVVVIGRLVNTDWGDDPKNQSRYQDYRFERSNDSEENDITNRKAQEIIDFIDSGQLVYLDREIYDESIEATKLYRNFIDKNGNPITGSNLITSETIKELTIEKIFEKYQTISYRQKQVDLTVVDNTPSDITTDDLDSADGIPSNRTRTMTVNIPIKENGEAENVELKLYLDLNGDGLFSDDEVAAQRTDLVTPLNDFELNYSIHPDFIGLLSWKLEVTKGDSNHPIKTYITGNMNFHRLPGQTKKLIRVLQVSNNENFMYADKEGTKSKPYDTLDLSRNTNFQQLLKQKELKDYEFSITIISLSAYNSIMKGEELPSWYPEAYQLSESEKLGIRKLNGYYDMVILGFADNFTKLGTDILGDEALNQLQNYVDTGQGLMLTHDTILYNEGNIDELPSTGYKMLERFRVLSGQSRYAPLNQNIDSSIMFDPDRLEGISSDICNSGETEEEKKINAAKCIMYSGGTTATLMNKWGSQEWGTQTGNMSTLSTMVYGINQALITSYPFNLIDNINNTIAIRRTHGQYLQLNLEDEEVVPWFTNTYYNENNEGTHKDTEQYEVDNKINPYDVRNNYYTYSRKNITYSGTGEQKREYTQYPQSELMLFVNTIIKAERGANHAPTLEVRNLYEGMSFSKYQPTLNFSVIPYDMDLDTMKLSINIYGCKEAICENQVIESFKDEDYTRINGESVSLSLDLNNKVNDFDTLKVKVQVTDEHGADSKELIYTLRVTDNRLLNITSSSSQYLIGDTATVSINIQALGSQAFGGKYELRKISPILSPLQENQSFQFEINSSNGSQTYDYQFKVLEDSRIQTSVPTTVSLLANYRYCLGDDKTNCSMISDTQEITVNVKRGKITLNFSSNIAGLFGNHNIVVELLHNGKVVKTAIVNNSNNVIFDSVPSGTYSLRINCPDSLTTKDYIIKSFDEGDKTILWGQEQEINVSYENNDIVKEYAINEVNFDLVHGLFKSQTDDEIIIEESTWSSLTEVIGNTLVNFGATFTTKQNSNDVILRVSDKFKDFTENSIRILKVVNNNDSISLQPLSGINIEQQSDSRSYNIKLPKDLKEGTNILVFYTGLVPNENISLLTNTIIVGATIKDVSIGVKANDKDEEISNSYLPDLF